MKTADREARRTDRRHRRASSTATGSPTSSAQRSTSSPTPTSSTARRSRSCGCTSSHRSTGPTRRSWSKRGALDFGEQIAAVTELFKRRPNVLRRWQRQYRYILVDEFQDANIAQIELIELLGRTPDRPDNVMVVGDDDQSIYRFRGASFAAFAEFDRRFSAPADARPGRDATRPAAAPADRAELPIGAGACSMRRIGSSRATPRDSSRTSVSGPSGPTASTVQVVVCGGAEDEAVAIVDAHPRAARRGHPNWSDAAVLYRKHKHREAIVARLRDEDIPYTVVGGLTLFATPEIRDLEQACAPSPIPHDDVALTRVMTAGPWRLDALEILHVSRIARFDRTHLYRRRHRARRRRARAPIRRRATTPSPRRRRPAPSSAGSARPSTSSTTRPGARARTRSSSATSS